MGIYINFNSLPLASSLFYVKERLSKGYPVNIVPYVEKQGSVIRLNIKETYLNKNFIKKNNEPFKRSIINSWTPKSRKRLLEKLLMIDLDNQNVYVSLLTYSTKFKKQLTPEILRKNHNKFFTYLHRLFPSLGIVWKLEFTRQGMPHLHLLITTKEKINPDYLKFNISRLWNKVLSSSLRAPSGYWSKIDKFHQGKKNFQPMKTKGVISYYSCYMTKYKEKEYQNKLPDFLKRPDKSLRFWGISYGSNILTYEKETIILNHWTDPLKLE